MNSRTGRLKVIVASFALLLAGGFVPYSSAKAQQHGAPPTKHDSTTGFPSVFPAGMFEAQAAMMGPMVTAMTQATFDAKLARLAKPETALALATFVKNFYVALLDKGFTKEEALKLVGAIGIPGFNGSPTGY